MVFCSVGCVGCCLSEALICLVYYIELVWLLVVWVCLLFVVCGLWLFALIVCLCCC